MYISHPVISFVHVRFGSVIQYIFYVVFTSYAMKALNIFEVSTVCFYEQVYFGDVFFYVNVTNTRTESTFPREENPNYINCSALRVFPNRI